MTNKVPNQYTIRTFLTRQLERYGMTLLQQIPSQNYDTFIFGLNHRKRHAIVEIDFNGNGYNLRIKRGSGKKDLDYDNRFHIDFKELLLELRLFINKGE